MNAPRVSAAALANTTVPSSARVAATAPGSGVSRHWRSAYVGLPGPANTQRASRSRVSARSRSAPGPGSRGQSTGSTRRPTLSAK